MKIRYTVIIPHKNSLSLLHRCVNSIPIREDIEVVIIDDKSSFNQIPNNTIFGSRLHGRIIHVENGCGAGTARNIGVLESRGEWLLFADADDFFIDHAFDHFDSAIVEHSGMDICYFKVDSRYSDTLEKADRDRLINRLVDQYSKHHSLEIRIKHLVPWGKLFNGDYVRYNKFKFDEVKVSNDIMFSVKSGFYAHKIEVKKQVVYCVTQNLGSLTNTISKENNRIRLNVALAYNKFLSSNGIGDYRTSLRPYVYRAKQFGVLEILKCIKLIYTMGDSLLYNFNLLRTVRSLFGTIKREELNRKYTVRK